MIKYAALLVMILLLRSCCESGPYELAGITVEYPDLTEESRLISIQVLADDGYEVIDSMSLGTLSEQNNFSIFINFEFYREDQVIYVENSPYADTITDIYFERSYCKKTIENFEYKLNGNLQSIRKIAITSPNQ